MKKVLSFLISICLMLGMVFSVPMCASAITIEEADTDDTLSAFFDFETKENMRVTSQSHSSEKCEWQIDAITKLEYHISGWGFTIRATNPVTEATSASGSVVNASEYALRAYKSTYNHWSTSGGIVVNRITDKGTEPLVLEDNTTYTVEFDYMVKSVHLYGEITDPNDSTNSFSISNSTENIMSFGYGYKVYYSTGLAPINQPVNTVATFASCKPSRDGDGYFTSGSEKKEVGNWYHSSYTFTTGTFDSVFSETNAPFLIFYASTHTGADMYVDNIRVKKHVGVNFHGMGGSLGSTTVTSAIGSPVNFPTAQRYGYDLTGWYKSGDCKELFTDTVLTKEMMGKTLYAGWTQDKYSFEGYAPAASGANASVFSVSSDNSYSGNKSMVYKYSKNSLEFLFNNRTSVKNYFTIRPITNGKTYKITFKYYHQSGPDVIAYPVTSSTSNSDNADTYTGSQITLSSAGTGKWHTATMVFTASVSNGNNLGLHLHANTNTATTLYIDDLTVTEVENGSGNLTINAGAGTTAGSLSRTVALAYGDKIGQELVYNNGFALEGFYTDAAFTTKVVGDIFTSALNGKTVYAKWGEKVDLTANSGMARSGAFSKANNEDKLYYNGSNGTASLANVNAGNYVIEFFYKSTESATISAAGGKFEVYAGENEKWHKGFIPVTVSSASVLQLSVLGNTALEIKDVYIKNMNSTVYVAFDSREHGGNVEILYGTAGQALEYVANPVVEGMRFDGWYSGYTLFDSDVYPSTSVSLTSVMLENMVNVKGDCNGDGKVSTLDIALLKLYLAGRDVALSAWADMNSDGNINSVDLVLLYLEVVQ